MIYRRFGRTGLELSILSAGFMRAMHSWQPAPDAEIPQGCQDNMEEIVRTALDLGVNHFETAHAYGTSEQQLGRALQGVPRDRFILQTKVQPAADPKQFLAGVHASLRRLKADRLDLLAIHGINDYKTLWQTCRRDGCLAAARSLQQEGKVGAIGLSGHGPPDVILEAVRFDDGRGGFDYLNLHWYYIYQVNTPALEAAAARDMGVFIISPTDKGGMLQDPPELFRRLCTPLEPMAFNDAWCLDRPEVHTISVGAARPSDFAAHVEAANLAGQGQTLAHIDEQCSQAMHKATGHRRPEALWPKLPPWDRTPGLINIPFILWLSNLAKGWGMEAYSRKRYKQLGHDVKWVPGGNGKDARHYDLKSVAEKAGLEHEELIGLLEEAHALLGEGG